MTEEEQSGLSEREVAAEYASGTVFDVNECAREPIHLLGSVQSYGALLALAEPELTVAMASSNTAAVLGVAPEALLGLPVADILGAEQAEQLHQAASDDGAAAIVPVQLEERKAGYQLEVSVHRGDGLVICEFEPSADEPFRFASFYPGVRRALLQLESTRTVTDLCQAAVRQVRAFAGYDRVVAYRFDGDGPGEVIAEDAAPGWEPWLGLWFPAIDVPPQARRLYLQNWIRIIADVDDRGAALVPPLRPGTQRPLDLSGSALRTVSGYHLEYLRNIGVRGSMSVSLIKDGRLWGLIACHSGVPRRLTADQRAACEMFGIALSLRLDAIEDRQRAADDAEVRRILQQMTATAEAIAPERFGEHIVAGLARLTDLIGADGVYLRFGAASYTSGLVPDLGDAAQASLARLPSVPVGRAWSTHRLREEAGELADLAGDCAGVLLVPLSPVGDVLAWFRGEVSRTVRWAADPERPVVIGSRGQRLTPRGSSSVWQETVRGQCLPWSDQDHSIAEETYRALLEAAVRHAPSTAGAEHARGDDELEAFARAASRALQEPLRGIADYATLIKEDSATLDDVTVKRLDTIRWLASRMDELLNSLLEYSRLGLADLRTTPVSLDDVLDDIEEILGARLAEADVQLRRPMRLGAVSGDRIWLQEVLVNLISDAVTYAAADLPRWVEVGYEDVVPPEAGQPVRAFYVRDNGTDFWAGQQQYVSRLVDEPGARGGGASAGLTISRRIIERHGGQMWVRSAPEQGTTFYFTV